MSSSSDSNREIQSSPEASFRTDSSADEPLCRRFMSKRNDSKSLMRTSKSTKPKISPTRLKPIVSPDDVRDSNQEAESTKFTLNDLNRMANLYPWPKGVTLCLPVENGDPLAKYAGSVVVYEELLKAGFRLPVPTFVRDFLRWTEFCLAQISPNLWRCISAFGIWCWKMNTEPTFLAMQCLINMEDTWKNFYTVYANLDIITNPSNVGNCKNKWFLVKKGDGYDFDFPIHPGKVGVKFRKGLDEMKDIPSEVQELRDAFLSLENAKRIDLHHSRLITHENLENAGLSLPHPTQSKKPRLRLIKSAIRKQNNVNSSKSKGDSKKTVRPRSPPGPQEERPTKKKFDVTPVQLKETSLSRPSLGIDSPHSPERRPNSLPRSQPNILASSLTIEETNALLNGAIVNVDSAVSTLGSLSDEQANSEFALHVYHANNLIQKHEKLFRAKESALQNEESLKKEIQILKDYLKKTQEQNADNLKKIQEQNADNLKKIQEQNADNLKKIQEQNADNLKNSLEENAEQRQKITELKTDLSRAKNIGKEEFLNSKGFYRHVAHFNATYYMTGLRVGVCQAVNKYQHLDPKIVEFEPDFDDDCGYEVPDPPPYSSPVRLVP